MCENIPDTAGPRYLNFLYQLMAIQSSSGSSHLRPGGFHMFYKYTTDITYITESGRKKNKQAWIWVVSPKRKKGQVLALFWHSVHPWLSRACIQTKFPHSYQERWIILSRWLTWLLGPQVPTPRFSRRLFLTVTFPWLSLTPICWLHWELAFPRIFLVS